MILTNIIKFEFRTRSVLITTDYYVLYVIIITVRIY